MQSSFRVFAWGVICTVIVANIVIRNSDEHKQFVQLKELKADCEKDLPRNENCVIIALPKSKD